MLEELRIRNFAIIRDLELTFQDGLVVFTGETGAGKSIILGALEMLFGSRADMSDMRSGAERATVEAVFRLPGPVREPVNRLLEAEGLLEDPEVVILSRELRVDRRNLARVNGHQASVSLLVELGEHLIDIHGQSEHLSLLRVKQHRALLDRYANLGDSLERYHETYRSFREVEEELNRLREMEREAERRLEMLEYQVEEIEAAHLKAGEDEELKAAHKRLANAERLAEVSQRVLVTLDDAPPDQPTVEELMGQVVEDLETLAEIDPSQEALGETSREVFENMTVIAHQLRRYLETIEFDPVGLSAVEERLDLIRSLKRKYGETIEEVLAYGEAARGELDTITHRGERIEELERSRIVLLEKIGAQGRELTERRKAGARQMADALETELEDLRMEKARFQVDFQYRENPGGVENQEGLRVAFMEYGLEDIEFLIETNPGEGFKPMVKIASGGETARLMLALKQVLARADHIPCLVFDEIDQGIGGRVGSIVGYKLRKLAREHQVICITHLPQLAGYGEQHYRVIKDIEDGRTVTRVQMVEGEERVDELCQMLGGSTGSNRQAAEDILKQVREHTASL